jgi:hypothetical protein
MSRTFRPRIPKDQLYRKPKTFNEIRQLHYLDFCEDLKEYSFPVYHSNRVNRYIPTSRDDIDFSRREREKKWI